MKTTDARKKIRAARAAKRRQLKAEKQRKVATKIKRASPSFAKKTNPTGTVEGQSGPPKNTVVMFSSGLDSTGALYWMLENTNDNIFVHRIILDNKEGRSEAESAAAKNIIRWLRQNCRSFDYAESSYSYKGYTPYDMYIYMHMAAIRGLELKRRGKKLDRVVTGSIQMYRKNTGVQQRRNKAWNIFNATYGISGVDWYKPLIEFTKEDVYNYLPKELSDLTHSCRKPKGLQVCGKCHSCMAMKRVKGLLSQQQIKQYKRWNE